MNSLANLRIKNSQAQLSELIKFGEMLHRSMQGKRGAERTTFHARTNEHRALF
jgi:hypothetical protein